MLRPWTGTNKPPLGVQPIPGHSRFDGLIGLYLFNEGAGAYAWDSSIYRNSGSYTGLVDWRTSTGGGGLYTDTDQYLTLSGKPNTWVSTQFSFVWIGSVSSLGSSPVFGQNRLDGFAYDFIGLIYTNSANASWYWAGGNPCNYQGGSFVVGRREVLGGTWNGNTMYAYRGGIKSTHTRADSGPVDNAYPFCIGGPAWGSISDPAVTECLALYNRFLSDQEMADWASQPYAMLGVPDLAAMREAIPAAGSRLFTQRNRRSVIAPGVIRC